MVKRSAAAHAPGGPQGQTAKKAKKRSSRLAVGKNNSDMGSVSTDISTDVPGRNEADPQSFVGTHLSMPGSWWESESPIAGQFDVTVTRY